MFPSMSSDRAYMRSDYPRRSTTALVWLVATIVAAFVIQLVLLSPWFGSGSTLVSHLALTIPGLKDWHVWTLVTHSLLHNTGNPFHILFILLGLIFVGRELEPTLGSKNFLAVYVSAILLGGLAWAAVHWGHGGRHIGAGAGVFALLVVLAGVHPYLEMSVFFFPVSIRIKHIVFIFLGVDLLGLVFYEFAGAAIPLGLTPSAHLGGMLAGWLYLRFFHASAGWDRAAGFSLPKWLRFASGKPKATTPSYGQRRPADRLRSDVDRILDKINSHGFGSLSDEEKRTLDEAKDMLSKR
jgi:membrane associated rhomboid family serine protease